MARLDPIPVDNNPWGQRDFGLFGDYVNLPTDARTRLPDYLAALPHQRFVRLYEFCLAMPAIAESVASVLRMLWAERALKQMLDDQE